MSSLISIPLWMKTDQNDKTASEPEGSFMLSGQIETAGVDLVLKEGKKLGLTIRRNKAKKTGDKAPDFYGEVWAMNEQAGGRG